MKKYIVLFSVSAVIIAFVFCTPLVVTAFLPQIRLVSISEYRYSDTVRASGSIIEQSVKNISTEYPFVPKAVYCEIGDRVHAGDLLAVVDKRLTVDMIADLSQSAPELIPSKLATLLAEANGDAGTVIDMIPENVTATSDGEVTALNLTSGVMCDAGAVVTISETDKLGVKLSVNESDISKIKQGQKVKITGNGLKKQYNGRVKKIYPTAKKQLVQTAQQTVVEVLVSFDRVSNEMKAGFTVNAEIQTSAHLNIDILPYEAVLQDESGQEFVYVYKNGQAVKKNVGTGTAVACGVQIISGVEKEDFVIYNAGDLNGEAMYVGIVNDRKKGE